MQTSSSQGISRIEYEGQWGATDGLAQIVVVSAKLDTPQITTALENDVATKFWNPFGKQSRAVFGLQPYEIVFTVNKPGTRFEDIPSSGSSLNMINLWHALLPEERNQLSAGKDLSPDVMEKCMRLLERCLNVTGINRDYAREPQAPGTPLRAATMKFSVAISGKVGLHGTRERLQPGVFLRASVPHWADWLDWQAKERLPDYLLGKGRMVLEPWVPHQALYFVKYYFTTTPPKERNARPAPRADTDGVAVTHAHGLVRDAFELGFYAGLANVLPAGAPPRITAATALTAIDAFRDRKAAAYGFDKTDDSFVQFLAEKTPALATAAPVSKRPADPAHEFFEQDRVNNKGGIWASLASHFDALVKAIGDVVYNDQRLVIGKVARNPPVGESAVWSIQM